MYSYRTGTDVTLHSTYRISHPVNPADSDTFFPLPPTPDLINNASPHPLHAALRHGSSLRQRRANSLRSSRRHLQRNESFR
jgi:hypothetical protein